MLDKRRERVNRKYREVRSEEKFVRGEVVGRWVIER
jgi:hypothetical protein